jgi:hypothetical protein
MSIQNNTELESQQLLINYLLIHVYMDLTKILASAMSSESMPHSYIEKLDTIAEKTGMASQKIHGIFEFIKKIEPQKILEAARQIHKNENLSISNESETDSGFNNTIEISIKEVIQIYIRLGYEFRFNFANLK